MSSYLKKRLKPHGNSSTYFWVDEAIWGHRLYDEQKPWLVFMEFLNVYVHEKKKGRAFIENDDFNKLQYSPFRRLYLRYLLFNNPHAFDLLIESKDNKYLWRKWLQKSDSLPGIAVPNLNYLQNRFGSYQDFVEVLKILQQSSLETNSNKRWTSKFVFPFGPECLYEDLDMKARTNDRRFFGRTGELLYLMLCRSKSKENLKGLLDDHDFFKDTTWNKLTRALQPNVPECSSAPGELSFLPYEEHSTFDNLGKDWVTLLKLNIPDYDAFPHMVTLAGLHLLRYQLVVSHDILNEPGKLKIVCEIVAPKKTIVREVSISIYQENNQLSRRTVDAYIDSIVASEDWQRCLKTSDPFIECKNLLRDRVRWPDDGDYEGNPSPESLIEELKSGVTKRHVQHVANIHRVYGKDIGLVSRRNTNRMRYAPSDTLLKSLLLANVTDRMEFYDFLNLLWKRYSIIIGDRVGEKTLDKDYFDKKAFQANSKRLEERLSSLSLLKRLSDGCAYVINPYTK